MFFPDLSDYEYRQDWYRPHTLNLGWLEKGCPFNTVKLARSVMDALWELCQVSVFQTRGFHACDFCQDMYDPIIATRRGGQIRLGSAEVRLFGGPGVIYAAPNLIFHYVESHLYEPPADFIAALLAGPRPPDQTYFDELTRYRIPWSRTLGQSPESSMPTCDYSNTAVLSAADRKHAAGILVGNSSAERILHDLGSVEQVRALMLRLLLHALDVANDSTLSSALALGEYFGYGSEHEAILAKLSTCIWHGYQRHIQAELSKLRLPPSASGS